MPILLLNGTTLVKGQNFINEKRAAGSPLTISKFITQERTNSFF